MNTEIKNILSHFCTDFHFLLPKCLPCNIQWKQAKNKNKTNLIIYILPLSTPSKLQAFLSKMQKKHFFQFPVEIFLHLSGWDWVGIVFNNGIMGAFFN